MVTSEEELRKLQKNLLCDIIGININHSKLDHNNHEFTSLFSLMNICKSKSMDSRIK